MAIITKLITLLELAAFASSMALHEHSGLTSSVSVQLKRRVVVDKALQKQGRSGKKMAYFGEVMLGVDKQRFSVVYDTGSGNLIVPGSTCQSKACLSHAQFTSSQNTKRVMCDGSPLNGEEGDELKITFGTGHITGKCLKDTICISNACVDGIFLSSTDESNQPFAEFTFDGVLGLALESMAQSPQFSMMSRLVSEDALAHPVFSVFLSDSDDETSEITFGSIKKEHMDGELFWVDVTGDTGYWEVRIEDITLNNKRQQLCEDCKVAVDTGTSQLAGPTDLIEKLRTLLEVQSDCSGVSALPKLGFIIGGKVLNLMPADYVDQEGGCSLSLMSLDVPPPKGPLFVFGIPFLQKFFTVYDSKQNRVGFAVAKHTTPVAEGLLGVAVDTDPSPKLNSFLARS